MRFVNRIGLFCLLGCHSPKKTSLQFMQELKMGQYDNASFFTSEGTINAHPRESNTAREAVASLFSRMEYEIIDIVTQREEATVHLQVENVKTAEILAVVAMETMKKGAQELYDQKTRKYDESFLQGVQAKIDDPTAKFITTDVHLHLKKYDSAWKITNQKMAIRQLLGL